MVTLVLVLRCLVKIARVQKERENSVPVVELDDAFSCGLCFYFAKYIKLQKYVSLRIIKYTNNKRLLETELESKY